MKKDGKKITIEELAAKTDQGFLESDKRFDELIKKMDQGFKEADARTDKKIEELARMTMSGFDEVNNNLNSFRKEMYDFRDDTKRRLINLEHDVSDIKQHLNDIGIRINYIEQKSKEDKKDIISEVSKLKKRINILEKQFLQLKSH